MSLMAKQRPDFDPDRRRLLSWFLNNQRPLPWRENRDPYRIWISETMLQQTTTAAVIPYFHRFLEKFPNLKSLAFATEKEVRSAWAGLGYYSRASNLWRAAQEIHQLGEFPQSHKELMKYPGFGPYTSRAVASLAFGESVGVLDGNVIRVLCRFYDLSIPWWKTIERNRLQNLSDQWAAGVDPRDLNQALMELGATICTPKSPSCAMCPLRLGCQGLKSGQHLKRPLARPRKAKEIWLWRVCLNAKNDRIALTQSHALPVLKGHLLPPGQAVKLKKKPKRYKFVHTITHHEIYVDVTTSLTSLKKMSTPVKWIPVSEISQHSPTSLIKKVVRFAL